MNFAVSLINLTLLSLKTSNLLASPFISRHDHISASRITMSRSFGPAFFNFEKLELTHSHFSRFLETVVIKNEMFQVNGAMLYDVMNPSLTGGGVYTLGHEYRKIFIRYSSFQMCCSNTTEGGGVLYAEVSQCQCELETVSAYHCTARIGAFAVVKQRTGTSGSQFKINCVRTFDCSPSARQACNASLYVNIENVDIFSFNVSDSHVMNQGAGISIHGCSSVSVRDFAVFRSRGNSVIDLICPLASDISLERIHIVNSTARSYGLLFVYGHFEVKYGSFFGNAGRLVHSQAGKVHFTRCWFDFQVEDGVTEEFELCPIADDPRHFIISFPSTGNWRATYQGNIRGFVDQREDVPPEMTEPPTKTVGFAMNTTGILTIASACLLIVALAVALYYIMFLQMYRQHVVHRVHIHCADEYNKKNTVEDELLPLDIFEDDGEQQIIDYNIPIGNVWDTDDEGVIQANADPLDDNDEASEAMRRRREEEMWEKRAQEARKNDYGKPTNQKHKSAGQKDKKPGAQKDKKPESHHGTPGSHHGTPGSHHTKPEAHKSKKPGSRAEHKHRSHKSHGKSSK